MEIVLTDNIVTIFSISLMTSEKTSILVIMSASSDTMIPLTSFTTFFNKIYNNYKIAQKITTWPRKPVIPYLTKVVGPQD